jgi:hypothetical protein
MNLEDSMLQVEYSRIFQKILYFSSSIFFWGHLEKEDLCEHFFNEQYNIISVEAAKR